MANDPYDKPGSVQDADAHDTSKPGQSVPGPFDNQPGAGAGRTSFNRGAGGPSRLRTGSNDPQSTPTNDPGSSDGGGSSSSTGGSRATSSADELRGGEENPADSPAGEGSGNFRFNPGGDTTPGRSAPSPGDLSQREAAPGKKDDDNDDDDSGGGLFRDDKSGNTFRARIQQRKKEIAMGVTSIGVLGTLIGALFFGLSSLGLTNFMSNIEKAGFGRYQVDMRGRSSQWLKAYVMMRMGEVDDPNLAPKDRDNLLFRSNKVDNNKPFTDWYRTMRASKFEEDVFHSRGIKFTSTAKREGGILKARAGLVTFKTGEEVRFNLSAGELDAIMSGDVNGFNGRLNDFVDVKVFENDKEARGAIKKLVKEEYPGWWRATKRWHLRKDIQNMVGVRSWTFFERTREKAAERKISIRNKIVTSALPEDSKSGKFIKCLFGIDNCSSTTDPANPKARAYTPDGTKKSGDKTVDGDGDPNTSDPVAVGDGSGEDSLKEGADGAAADGIRKTLISKVFGAAGLASMLDSLARFSESIKEHKFSKLVVKLKGDQVAGLYTVFAVANDQRKTGELTSEEMGDFMNQFKHPTDSEGWATVVDPGSSSGTVSAATTGFEAAKDKAEFCSEKHQEEMALPENREAAEKEHQYLCPKNKVGSAANVIAFENAWNSGPGAILGPLLAAYHSVAGGIIGAFNSLIGGISDAALSVLGLKDDVEDVAAYAAEQAMEFGGAVLDIGEYTPSGQVGNFLLQGASVLGEASMRNQGGATTTTTASNFATKNYLAWQAEEQQGDLSSRYLSLDNPDSFASHQVAMLNGLSLDSLFQDFFKVFGNALSSPSKAISAHAGAQNDDGYGAARFTGIRTFDLPEECINARVIDMTPQSATNADDLGIFTPEELTWELLSNKTTFYDALYQKVGDDEELAMKVWNCGLIDNTARAGLGARYGYKGEDAFQSSGAAAGPASDEPAAGSLPSGSAQELAKQLIDSGKLSDQDGRYMAQIKAISQGDFSCNINPTILKMLVGVVVQDGHKVVMSSLNRRCTGVLTASGTGSYHYRDGGGHAVDVVMFDGKPVTGSGPGTIEFLTSASKYLPKNTGYGQVLSCNSGFKIPEGSYAVPDTCNHLHIQVPEQKAE